jgi:hypothetical protein
MMPSDATRVLAMCNLYDPRFGSSSPEEAKAWFQALRDLDGDDAVEAVVRHYSTATDRCMPGHVRQGVMAIRDERRRNQPSAPRELPSRFEDDMGRQVRIERGAATIRGVLGPLLEHIAAQRPELPSAFDELRALTSESASVDSDDDATDGGPR